MKLTHYQYFKPIEVTTEQSGTLIIENPIYYRKIINDLYLQKETGYGEFVLADSKDKIYELSKSCLLITDFFNYVSLEKQIKTKLNAVIINDYQNSDEVINLISKINEIGIDISNNYMYPIKFKETITFQDVVKMMDFSIDYEALDFWETFIEYIKLCFELFDYKILVTINLKDLISEEEFKFITGDLKNRNIPILMIERHEHKGIDDDMNTVLIDKDLCML